MKRFRLSLLTLLLLMTTVAAVVGLYGARRRIRLLDARMGEVAAAAKAEIAALEAENTRLREEGGVLTITDPKKIHALQLQKLGESLTWTYRVYLPPGRDYFVACAINKLPIGDSALVWAGSPPDTRTIKSGASNQTAVGLGSGEYLISARVFRDENKKWRYLLNVRGSGENPPLAGKTGGSEIILDDDSWPAKQDAFSSQVLTSTKIARPDTTEPFVLVDYRSFGRKVRSSADSDEGAMVWIEAVPKP